MAIVVTNIGNASSKTTGATLNITVPAGGVPAGSLIVVIHGAGASDQAGPSGSQTPPTDSASNSYTSNASLFIAQDAFGVNNGQISYCFNCAALSSGNTISVGQFSTSGHSAAAAFYATGIETASDPFDVGGVAENNTTSVSASTSGSVSSSGSLIVGAVTVNGSNVETFTQDSTNQGGFSASPAPVKGGTTGAGATSNHWVAGGYVVWGSTGTATFAPTIGTARQWSAIVAAFKAKVETFDLMPQILL